MAAPTPIADRWWLLPRFRPDVVEDPRAKHPNASIARLMRELPLPHSEAEAHRAELAAA